MNLQAFNSSAFYRSLGQYQLPASIPYSAADNEAEPPARLTAELPHVISPGCLLETWDSFTARSGYVGYKVGVSVLCDSESVLTVTRANGKLIIDAIKFSPNMALVLWPSHPSGQASFYAAQRYLLSRAYPNPAPWAPHGFMTRHGYAIVGQAGEVERGALLCNSRSVTESAVSYVKGRLWSLIHSRDILPSSGPRAVATAIAAFDSAEILRISPSQSAAERIFESAASWVPDLRKLKAYGNAPNKP